MDRQKAEKICKRVLQAAEETGLVTGLAKPTGSMVDGDLARCVRALEEELEGDVPRMAGATLWDLYAGLLAAGDLAASAGVSKAPSDVAYKAGMVADALLERRNDAQQGRG